MATETPYFATGSESDLIQYEQQLREYEQAYSEYVKSYKDWAQKYGQDPELPDTPLEPEVASRKTGNGNKESNIVGSFPVSASLEADSRKKRWLY